MGISFKMIPYTSHIITETVAKANINKEISDADFVFHVLITCGKKVMAEMLPAAMPKSCIDVIIMCKYAYVKIGKWENVFIEYSLGCLVPFCPKC